jgi:hypothetical protein
MSTLTPVSASISVGANGKWTLTSSIADTSQTYGYSYTVDVAPSMISLVFTMPANGQSVEIDIGPVTLDPTIYVTIGVMSVGGGMTYLTSIVQQLSSKITVGGGNASGTYTPILDFDPPTLGKPRLAYTEDLFNSAINAYGYGLYPVHYQKDGSGRLSYLGGTSTSIAAPPVFTVQPVSQSVALGQDVSFTCDYVSAGNTTAQWYKNGSTLVYTDTSIYVSSVSTFTINGITEGDYADYTCKVTNGYGTATSSIATLSKHTTVATTLSMPSTITVDEGSTTAITVTLDAGTITQFNWYYSDIVFDSFFVDVPNSGSSHAISSGTGGYLWVAGATSTYSKTWTAADNNKVINIYAPCWYAGDGNGTASIKVTVTPVAVAAPVLVSSPPASLAVNYGDAGSSISASFSGTGVLVYNWQISSDSGSSWTSLDPRATSIWSGVTTPTLSWTSPPGTDPYSIPAGQPLISAGVYWLRCACTNSIGTTYSNTCVWTLTGSNAGSPTLAYRPSAGTALSIFPNAIDTGASTSIDSSSYSTKTVNDRVLTYTFSGFGTGIKTGTLYLRGNTLTETNDSPTGIYTAVSAVSISYSHSGGNSIFLVDASGEIGGDITNTNPVASGTLTNIDLSTLSVSVMLQGDMEGPLSDRAFARASLDLYDIVFLTN